MKSQVNHRSLTSEEINLLSNYRIKSNKHALQLFSTTKKKIQHHLLQWFQCFKIFWHRKRKKCDYQRGIRQIVMPSLWCRWSSLVAASDQTNSSSVPLKYSQSITFYWTARVNQNNEVNVYHKKRDTFNKIMSMRGTDYFIDFLFFSYCGFLASCFLTFFLNGRACFAGWSKIIWNGRN